MEEPKTVSDISALDRSLTDLTDRSSDSEPEIKIDNPDYLLEDERLIIHHPVTRSKFWTIIREVGSIDKLVEIDWSYQTWEDKIPEDLELLRNQLAYFYLEDPWPDLHQVLQNKNYYPNIVGLKVMNLLDLLTPANLIDFIKLFPNLRWIHFARNRKNQLRRTDWLAVTTAQKMITQYNPSIAIDLFD